MARAKPVRVVNPANTRVVLIGCGGTGGALLQNLARLLYGLKDTRNGNPARRENYDPRTATAELPQVIVADGDTVAEENILRQPFVLADVGEKKALVLSARLGAAYGLSIHAYPHYLTPETDLDVLVREGSIVVGCVDNPPTRKLLHEKLRAYKNIVYLDAGNAGVPLPEGRQPETRQERVAVREGGWEGQVVCGVRKDNETLMPFPAEVFEDLVEGEAPLPTEAPSCGQVVTSMPQRHQTNLFAATVLMSYLGTLLTEGAVMNHLTFFDARQGYLRSKPAIEVLDSFAA